MPQLTWEMINRTLGTDGPYKVYCFCGTLTTLINSRDGSTVARTPSEAKRFLIEAEEWKEPLTYSVVVRDPNSWTQNKDGSNREYEIRAHCGHHHKTVEAAQACKDKLTAWYCICGERSDSHRRCSSSTGHTANSTSARWYNARVEDSTGRAIDSL